MDDLFNMLDKKSNETKIKQNELNFKIEKNEKQKKFLTKPLHFNSKKIFAFGIGTMMIFSGLSTFMNKKTSSVNSNSDSGIFDNEKSITNVVPEDNKYNWKKADFVVGNHKDINFINKFKETEEYDVIEKYSKQYGVDPQIITAIAFKESSLDHEACLPTGDRYNNCAIGIMQLEKEYDGKEICAYNYETNKTDSVKYTLENVKNFDTNVKIACMMFQSALENYNGNIYMAIQSHNYGEYMMDIIVNKTAIKKNINTDFMTSHPFDIDWTDYLEEVHLNPKKYLDEWNYKTYGDPNYLKTIISLCTDPEAKYLYDGKYYNFDLQYGYMHENERSFSK